MNPREQMQMQDAIAALQARGDLFTRQLINEKQRVAQLQAKLNEVNGQINDVRESNKKRAISLLNMHTTTANDAYRRADGLDPTRLARDNQKKLVRNLEGRLNKALVRQNGIENENNAIKGKIDKLRRKIHNDNLNRASMAKELESIQEQMDDIMRRAALATDQREKIVEQKNQILRENIDEQEKFHAEYQKLSKMIADQAQMLEESIAAVASDVVTKSNTAETGQSGGEATEGINPIEEMRALDEKIDGLDKQYEANRRALQKTEEKIRTYEENFRQLREVSGLTSTDEIIKAFVKNEEESFSIFNYIQAVNQENDIMLEQRTQLEHEIEALRTDQMNKENQRASIINEYKGNLKDAQEERQKMAEVAREGKDTVLKISKKVQGLYIRLRCRPLDDTNSTQMQVMKRPIHTTQHRSDRKLTMLGGEEISEKNILHHMELIEKRSIQIIGAYAKKLAATRRGAQRRPSVLMSPKSFGRVISTAPGYGDDEDSGSFCLSDEESDDGSNDRPMSVHDMRRQAAFLPEFIH